MNNSPDLTNSIGLRPRNANEYIEHQLDARIREIEDEFKGDAIGFTGPLIDRVDDIIRAAVERKYNEEPKRDRLVFILTTHGGYIEVVDRIVDTLRKDYTNVDFVVPNYAYSAGTVLAMSGDAIYMDYYSRLGPIDPQIELQSGRFVPALGYLERYNELIEKSQKGTISIAEVQLLINGNGFDQAELYKYEQSRELSITLLKKWLVKYKFKNWKTTQTRKLPVTAQMKKIRAGNIAKELNKTRKWHTHGYGISKDVIINDLNLLIDDFGTNPKLSFAIRSYYDLLTDYMIKRDSHGAIHFDGNYQTFM